MYSNAHHNSGRYSASRTDRTNAIDLHPNGGKRYSTTTSSYRPFPNCLEGKGLYNYSANYYSTFPSMSSVSNDKRNHQLVSTGNTNNNANNNSKYKYYNYNYNPNSRAIANGGNAGTSSRALTNAPASSSTALVPISKALVPVDRSGPRKSNGMEMVPYGSNAPPPRASQQPSFRANFVKSESSNTRTTSTNVEQKSMKRSDSKNSAKSTKSQKSMKGSTNSAKPMKKTVKGASKKVAMKKAVPMKKTQVKKSASASKAMKKVSTMKKASTSTAKKTASKKSTKSPAMKKAKTPAKKNSVAKKPAPKTKKQVTKKKPAKAPKNKVTASMKRTMKVQKRLPKVKKAKLVDFISNATYQKSQKALAANSFDEEVNDTSGTAIVPYKRKRKNSDKKKLPDNKGAENKKAIMIAKNTTTNNTNNTNNNKEINNIYVYNFGGDVNQLPEFLKKNPKEMQKFFFENSLMNLPKSPPSSKGNSFAKNFKNFQLGTNTDVRAIGDVSSSSTGNKPSSPKSNVFAKYAGDEANQQIVDSSSSRPGLRSSSKSKDNVSTDFPRLATASKTNASNEVQNLKMDIDSRHALTEGEKYHINQSVFLAMNQNWQGTRVNQHFMLEKNAYLALSNLVNSFRSRAVFQVSAVLRFQAASYMVYCYSKLGRLRTTNFESASAKFLRDELTATFSNANCGNFRLVSTVRAPLEAAAKWLIDATNSRDNAVRVSLKDSGTTEFEAIASDVKGLVGM